MPRIMLNDAVTEISLTGVDHFTTTEDAARALWDDVYAVAKIHGGAPSLAIHDNGECEVQWSSGPIQWADAYVVGEDVNTAEFSCEARNGDAVVFFELPRLN